MAYQSKHKRVPASMSRNFTRRITVLVLVFFAAVTGIVYVSHNTNSRSYSLSDDSPNNAPQPLSPLPPAAGLTHSATSNTPIAPKMGNVTAKAELGRAAWHLFHTTLARFPERPTTDESEALRSYVHLFQRLYPCGECAEHFGEVLRKFPPQVSSRSAAALWGCVVHNEVNKELGKSLFDCSKIGDFYDCGCADDETEENGGKIGGLTLDEVDPRSGKKQMSEDVKEKIKTNGREINEDLFGGKKPVIMDTYRLAYGD